MKSDVIMVDSKGGGMDEAFAQVEAVAAYRGLSHKDTLHLRLLTEEMMGMLKAIAGEVFAKFWIEDELRAGHFVLHLNCSTGMDFEKRKQLLEISSSGQNAAVKGVTGKIREFFERALVSDPSNGIPSYVGSSFLAAGALLRDASTSSNYVCWSMQKYKEDVAERRDQEETAQEAWDELEKSIVANLADEIAIGIQGNEVEMLVYKNISK